MQYIFLDEDFYIKQQIIVKAFSPSKFNSTKFWKRHSTHLDLLFQMRLVTINSSALIRPIGLIYGNTFSKNGIQYQGNIIWQYDTFNTTKR